MVDILALRVKHLRNIVHQLWLCFSMKHHWCKNTVLLPSSYWSLAHCILSAWSAICLSGATTGSGRLWSRVPIGQPESHLIRFVFLAEHFPEVANASCSTGLIHVPSGAVTCDGAFHWSDNMFERFQLHLLIKCIDQKVSILMKCIHQTASI